MSAARSTAVDRTGSLPAADPTAEADLFEPPTFQLSLKSLLAGAAAAITAAVLGSRLGVAGTLIGAGLASSVSMIAAAVYSHSLAAAAYRVKAARSPQDGVARSVTEPIATVHQAWGELPTVAITPAERPTPEVRTPLRAWRSRWVAAGLGVVAVCALALVAVTGIEAVRGTPLSGGSAGGLSVLGGAPVGVADAPATGRTSLDPATPAADSSAGPDSAPAPILSTATTGSAPLSGSHAPEVPATGPASTTVTSTVTVSPAAPSTSAASASAGSSGSTDPAGVTTAGTTGATPTTAPTTTAPTATVPPANERATTTGP
ncbi:MAG: hypothetical protein ABIR83_14855 [Nakamurella sp.]